MSKTVDKELGNDVNTIYPQAKIQIDWCSITIVFNGQCSNILPPCRQPISQTIMGCFLGVLTLVQTWDLDLTRIACSAY